MGIIVLILLYVLLGVSLAAYIKRYCPVADYKRKIIIFLLLIAFFGLVFDVLIKRESVILFTVYFITAYLLSMVVFKTGQRHSLAISGIFSAVRLLVVLLWAYTFNIKL